MSGVPDRIGHLPNEWAAKFLTTAVLEQREPLPTVALDRASRPGRWGAEPVRHLVEEAMKRFTPESRTSADAWLSPVLHATLRLTRREAADPEIWNHLALRVAPDYLFWRHPGRPVTNRGRFSGPFHSQAFARLWWAAELFRDGPDYGPVVIACGNQDVLNTVLRLEVILHRPTAQAILRLLASGVVRTGREVNALAQAVNTAGSTLAYEALAPDVPQDSDSYRDWIEDLSGVLVPYDSLPDGPDDGRVPASAVGALVPLFGKLFAEAPVRGRVVVE
ncbi:DUF6339 family protein [Streptosporangium sp. V21-05]|uniref:DUF6339 family protein n=1 Tax=Streptosporangium sp. V21-05 TaxID=3446115 RepID=UPI003F533F8C